MLQKKCSPMVIALVTALCVFACEQAVSQTSTQPATGGSSSDPDEVLVQQAYAEFHRRVENWRRYLRDSEIGYSSDMRSYFTNSPFCDLAEMGPVAVPWVQEKALDSVFMMRLLTLISRAQWTDLAGLTDDEARDPARDHRKDLAAWSKSGPKASVTKARARVSSFRASAVAQKGVALETVRSSKEWKEVESLGVFGVPAIIERVQRGEADIHDYRLLQHWTRPLAKTERGGPVLPAMSESVAEEKQRKEYWLAWWEQNKWQFRWMHNDTPTTPPSGSGD